MKFNLICLYFVLSHINTTLVTCVATLFLKIESKLIFNIVYYFFLVYDEDCIFCFMAFSCFQ